MQAYIFRNSCESTRFKKIPPFAHFSWFGTTLILVLTLMNWRISAIALPLDEDREYQRSLNELVKNHSHPHRASDKRFTPFWAAQVDGGESTAKDLAAKYGFTYLGEVSAIIF